MRVLLTLFTSLVLATTLTSCSNQEPDTEPVPKLPPPSATTPEPEPWEVKSRAGVKAFLELLVARLSAAFTEGDVEPLRELTDTKCGSCADIADQIEEVYAAGGHIESSEFQFESWSIEGGVRDQTSTRVVYSSSPVTWVRTPNARGETFPGGVSEFVVEMRWTGDAWRVSSLVPV